MKAKSLHLIAVLVILAAIVCGGPAWAVDETLTPTDDVSTTNLSAKLTSSATDDSEQQFSAAMSIWFKHRYSEGENLLRTFSEKNPNSRWAAEADLHVGCNMTYMNRFDEARTVFSQVIQSHPTHVVAAKAKLRLGNVAERAGSFDEAIGHYCSVLKSNPTWDQFRYSNFEARKLLMTKRGWRARINCGPVALAACLEAVGKRDAAASERLVSPGPDGVTLAELVAEADKYGVKAHPVTMFADDILKAPLPVLAHVQPNHYLAITGIDGDKVQVEDSLRGKYELSLDALGKIWTGIALSFSPTAEDQPVAIALASEIRGGCCGQADMIACLGDCYGDCGQEFVTSSLSSTTGTCESCSGSASGPPSPGAPTWKVNTANLNLVVKDTPIWYDPGVGPRIEFTLTYSNESSDSGIFGRGWRSPYDMKIFFLPPPVQGNPTSLQFHRATGRVESYDYDSTSASYLPTESSATYGYRDTIEKLTDGTVVMSPREGGKYYFMPEGGLAEGRIHYIEDASGNRVTCEYDQTTGVLKHVIDANGGVTDVTTEGTGLDERVTLVTIPDYDTQNHIWGHGNGRSAAFGYQGGFLVSIRDMLTIDPNNASTLTYGALAWGLTAGTITTQAITSSPLDPDNGGDILVDSTEQFPPSGTIVVTNSSNQTEQITYTAKTDKAFKNITRGNSPIAAGSGASVVQVGLQTLLAQNVTTAPLSPDNGGDLLVDDTTGFPDNGTIAVTGSNGTEVMGYTSKTQTAFHGIKRGSPPYAADSGDNVKICCSVPYLYSIETPAKKTKFGYIWYSMALDPPERFVVALRDIYECGSDEDYPNDSTMRCEWYPYSYGTSVIRYPGPNQLAKWYQITPYSPFDLTKSVTDELGNIMVTYGHNWRRDVTSTTDANGNVTSYDFTNPQTQEDDGKHNIYLRTDPLGNTRTYTYENHKVATEKDPQGRIVKAYTYNAAGQVTKVETELTQGVRSILTQNWYYTNNTQLQNEPYYTYTTDASLNGKVQHTLDGRGKQTTYHYNENAETRGFLTSVEDPEGNLTAYHYDEKGRRNQVTDAGILTTTYEYDNLDRLTEVTNPDSTTVQTEYTCCYKVLDRDENGKVTKYDYDKKNRPWAVIDTAVNTQLAAALGLSDTQITVANTTGFPASGTILIKSSAGETEIATYGSINGYTLYGVVRGQFGTTAKAFASADVTQGNFTVNVYDNTLLERKTGLYDPNGHLTQFAYYNNDRPKKTTYSDGTWEQFTYDPAGNLVKKEFGHTDVVTRTVNYYYDANNRLVGTSSP
ncbi:MAG: cysteine peptidase family C39 domain-containing protein [Armatimonadota bacterium]